MDHGRQAGMPSARGDRAGQRRASTDRPEICTNKEGSRDCRLRRAEMGVP